MELPLAESKIQREPQVPLFFRARRAANGDQLREPEFTMEPTGEQYPACRVAAGGEWVNI